MVVEFDRNMKVRPTLVIKGDLAAGTLLDLPHQLCLLIAFLIEGVPLLVVGIVVIVGTASTGSAPCPDVIKDRHLITQVTAEHEALVKAPDMGYDVMSAVVT